MQPKHRYSKKKHIWLVAGLCEELRWIENSMWKCWKSVSSNIQTSFLKVQVLTTKYIAVRRTHTARNPSKLHFTGFHYLSQTSKTPSSAFATCSTISCTLLRHHFAWRGRHVASSHRILPFRCFACQFLWKNFAFSQRKLRRLVSAF